MRTVFDIANQVQATATGYEAFPFIPAALISKKGRYDAASFDQGDYATKATESITGSAPLRKYKGGVYYFMPVTFEHTDQKTKVKSTFNFDDAVVSVTGKKTIVETPLVGRKGTVKELINIDDYEIKLIAVLSGDDYPEAAMQELVRLFEINETIVMKCVITNYFLKGQDTVCIKSIDIPVLEGVEDLQVVTMTLASDQDFKLEIK